MFEALIHSIFGGERHLHWLHRQNKGRPPDVGGASSPAIQPCKRLAYLIISTRDGVVPRKTTRERLNQVFGVRFDTTKENSGEDSVDDPHGRITSHVPSMVVSIERLRCYGHEINRARGEILREDVCRNLIHFRRDWDLIACLRSEVG
jgi:hypothetical protein